MSTADVVRLAGHLLRRLDAVHGGMLPLVMVLLVAMAATAVPLTVTGAVLVCLRRVLVAAANYQGRAVRPAEGVAS